jgi:tubulin---tyrosine ligase
LKEAIPQTIILDTWSVWEAGDSTPLGASNLGNIAISMGSTGTMSGGVEHNINRRVILDHCLAEAKNVLEEAEREFEHAPSGDPALAPVWILKGSTVNKGVGIHIVHLYEQVADICWTESDIREWYESVVGIVVLVVDRLSPYLLPLLLPCRVLQRYIASPLLLNQRKFHIRAYVVAVDDLRVYLAHDCLALCSGTPYNLHDTSNLLAHITNTAFQDVDPNFSEESCVFLWNDDDDSELLPILVKDGSCETQGQAKLRVRKVFSDMGDIVAELFRAYESEFGVFSPMQGCFEQFGLDFVVEVVGSQWGTRLLEVNPGPDFKQTGRRLQSAIENLMCSTIDVALLHRQTSVHSSVGNLKLVYEKPNRINKYTL